MVKKNYVKNCKYFKKKKNCKYVFSTLSRVDTLWQSAVPQGKLER